MTLFLQRDDEEMVRLLQEIVDESEGERTGNSSDSLIRSSSSNSPTAIEVTTIRKRKPRKCGRKPAFKTPFIPSIRILKRDLRRKYMDMIINVKNSHDESLYLSFVKEFYAPNCTASQSFGNYTLFGFSSFKSETLEELQRSFNLGYFMMPDAITRFTSFQVCKRLNEIGSRIVGKGTLEGTVIRAPKDPQKIEQKLRIGLSGFTCEESEIDINDFVSIEPQRLILDTSFSFNLDEFHRFVHIESMVEDLQFLPSF